MQLSPEKFHIGRIASGLVIAAVAAYVVQALPVSFRGLLISSHVLTGPELGVLETFVGLLNSFIVTFICLIILKRPVVAIAVAAVIAQIIWIEWAYSFRLGGDTVAEAVLRYTEHVGVILGAGGAAWVYIRVFSRARTPAA